MKKVISYLPLWKTLLDKGLKKTDLIDLCGIGSGTLSKLSKNKEVSMTVLLKLCTALDVDMNSILVVEDVKTGERTNA